jgi:hypothetical protein
MTYLANLPNELWLHILSYLNIVDIFRAFHRLNKRFNNLIYDCARRITLPSNVTDSWLEKYMPQLEYGIKTICLNDESLQCVFDNKWSFPNLQLINIQENNWNISLRVRKKPIPIVLISSLKFLQNIDLSVNTFSIDMPSYILDVSKN